MNEMGKFFSDGLYALWAASYASCSSRPRGVAAPRLHTLTSHRGYEKPKRSNTVQTAQRGNWSPFHPQTTTDSPPRA